MRTGPGAEGSPGAASEEAAGGAGEDPRRAGPSVSALPL